MEEEAAELEKKKPIHKNLRCLRDNWTTQWRRNQEFNDDSFASEPGTT